LSSSSPSEPVSSHDSISQTVQVVALVVSDQSADHQLKAGPELVIDNGGGLVRWKFKTG
jgi:hypothetical protein